MFCLFARVAGPNECRDTRQRITHKHTHILISLDTGERIIAINECAFRYNRPVVPLFPTESTRRWHFVAHLPDGRPATTAQCPPNHRLPTIASSCWSLPSWHLPAASAQPNRKYALLSRNPRPRTPEISPRFAPQFRLERIQCPAASACSQIYCNLTRSQRNRPQLLNLGCTMNRTIDNVHVHLKMYSHWIGYRNALIDMTVDFCAFMADSSGSNPMVAAALPYFQRYTNVNHSCPYADELRMRDMPMDAGWLAGSLMPTGRYRGDWRFFERTTNETFLLARLNFAVN